MPIDLALPLYLSSDDSGYRRSPELCSNHPTLTFAPPKGLDHNNDTKHVFHKKEHKKDKKKVSFADHRGLSLTRVKTFSDSKDPIEVPLNIHALLTSAQAGSTLEEEKLVLGFTQPSADYLQFRSRLEQHNVCLEHCMLRERTLAGTVRVKNLSPQKLVHVRITFDAWKSHEDVECSYVMSTYPDSEHDTFSFDVLLPETTAPDEQIEFAIRYEENGHAHWDSNQGGNYRVGWSTAGAQQHRHQGKRRLSALGMHFDPYGSPTCSHGLFPNWPSYAAYENMGPYY